MNKKITLFSLLIFLTLSSYSQTIINCVIKTSIGDISLELYPDKAPITVSNFLRYVDADLYKNSSFFRTCTPENEAERAVKIEVIQGGDIPEEKLFVPIPIETTEQTGLSHLNGTISMARAEPNTAQSNFFICINDQPELDYNGKRNPDGHGFAAFGKVTKGMDVVLKIQSQKNTNQMMAEPITIYSIERTVHHGKIVKVLSFNILHGATTKGDFDLDAIARVIIETKPDLVALQEVDFKTKRAENYDLATELGWRAKMAPIFARAMEYDGGEYGEGVLSRYTFLSSRNVALPFSPGNEPRAALEIITILPSGDTIAFIGTHLDHLDNETDRISQALKINEVFSSNKYPTILAGDLNATPKSNPINILEEFWTSSYDKQNPKFTFPSDRPIKKIDYVMYYPNNRWSVLETKVIQDSIASDHCAYLVTLELIELTK